MWKVRKASTIEQLPSLLIFIHDPYFYDYPGICLSISKKSEFNWTLALVGSSWTMPLYCCLWVMLQIWLVRLLKLLFLNLDSQQETVKTCWMMATFLSPSSKFVYLLYISVCLASYHSIKGNSGLVPTDWTTDYSWFHTAFKLEKHYGKTLFETNTYDLQLHALQ